MALPSMGDGAEGFLRWFDEQEAAPGADQSQPIDHRTQSPSCSSADIAQRPNAGTVPPSPEGAEPLATSAPVTHVASPAKRTGEMEAHSGDAARSREALKERKKEKEKEKKKQEREPSGHPAASFSPSERLARLKKDLGQVLLLPLLKLDPCYGNLSSGFGEAWHEYSQDWVKPNKSPKTMRGSYCHTVVARLDADLGNPTSPSKYDTSDPDKRGWEQADHQARYLLKMRRVFAHPTAPSAFHANAQPVNDQLAWALLQAVKQRENECHWSGQKSGRKAGGQKGGQRGGQKGGQTSRGEQTGGAQTGGAQPDSEDEKPEEALGDDPAD